MSPRAFRWMRQLSVGTGPSRLGIRELQGCLELTIARWSASIDGGQVTDSGQVTDAGQVRDAIAAVPDFTLALEEARRGFDELNQELARIRTRAASALSAGSLSAAFLGGLTLRNPTDALSPWTFLAIAAFVLLALSNAVVLWPRSVWASVDPEKLISWALGDQATGRQPMTRVAMDMYLARFMGRKYNENSRTVTTLSWVYSAGVVALSLEIGFLIADLLSR